MNSKNMYITVYSEMVINLLQIYVLLTAYMYMPVNIKA